MGDAWTIATKDLRRRLRDRTAVLVALVLPFGLAFIFSLTLGDVESQGFEATYAVVDRDPTGHLPTEFTALLERLEFVTLREAATEARRRVARRRGSRSTRRSCSPKGSPNRCRPAGVGRSR